MGKNSKLQKSISVLLICIMLYQVSGCYSSKIITTNDLPNEGKYKYYIYDKVSKIRIAKPSISNGKFSGMKYRTELRLGSIDGKINIYLLPDSLLKFNNDSILVAEKVIEKVQLKRYLPGATMLLVVPIVLVTAGFMIYELVVAGEAFEEAAR
jgi:hypothetical protein